MARKRKRTRTRQSASGINSNDAVLQELAGGGLTNLLTGMGTRKDRVATSYLEPTTLSQALADKLVTESWFGRSFVNILIDDMFMLWREFEGDDAEAMEEAELRFDVRDKLSDAMKNSRKYGTGLILIGTRDQQFEEELHPDLVVQDDLLYLLVSSNHQARIDDQDYDDDISSYTFGQPLYYNLRLGEREIKVHRSRILRFDGSSTPNRYAPSPYGNVWSPSPLIAAARSTFGDEMIAQAVYQLSQESSMVTFKIEDLDRIIGDHGWDDSEGPSPSLKRRIEVAADMESLYRKRVVDKNSEAERSDVQWRGLDSMRQVEFQRLGAIAMMPQTRLMGTPPVGLNATGESDLRNYAASVMAQQVRLLTEPLKRLDAIVARSIGLTEPPPYEFKSLIDMSDLDHAQVAEAVARITQIYLSNGVIDERDALLAADEAGYYGDDLLDAPPPGRPEPDMRYSTTVTNDDA